jgi:hypothetical protein
MMSSPQSKKSETFRVARLAPRDRAMAAIRASDSENRPAEPAAGSGDVGKFTSRHTVKW